MNAGTCRQAFTTNATLLCGVGILVVFIGHGLGSGGEQQAAGRQNVAPVELRMLQPLVTGNLLVFLSWVWLDLQSRQRKSLTGEARVGLWLVAVFVAILSTFGGAARVALLESEPFLPFLLSVVAPVLVVTVPSLWLAAGSIEPSWLRALLLASVVAASATVPHGHSLGGDNELRVFTLNSCLIGLAITIWLLTWAATPERRRIA